MSREIPDASRRHRITQDAATDDQESMSSDENNGDQNDYHAEKIFIEI